MLILGTEARGMTMETGGNLTPDNRKWLQNIWHSKRLESEFGDCPDCGREGISLFGIKETLEFYVGNVIGVAMRRH